jgi:hypothetical protein
MSYIKAFMKYKGLLSLTDVSIQEEKFPSELTDSILVLLMIKFLETVTT